MTPDTPPDPERLSEVLRELISFSDAPVKEIASRAKVDYQRLNRWFTGKTATLDADMAESVYQTLTGKTFIRR